jgi:hypothetical protein
MNAIGPIQVTTTTKRTPGSRSAPAGQHASVEVILLKEELAHVRYALQALKCATQDFVRFML